MQKTVMTLNGIHLCCLLYTSRILPIAKEWQNRPLERKYAIVFMDAVHFHVREDNRTVKKAVYVAIGVKLNGKREVLGMWVGGNESAKYWLSVLNEIKNRGVEAVSYTHLCHWSAVYNSTR